jgi:hypothetical protein
MSNTLRTIAAMAVLASVSADYIVLSNFAGASCSGTPTGIVVQNGDCQATSGYSVSISCVNSSYAQMTAFTSSTVCSGTSMTMPQNANPSSTCTATQGGGSAIGVCVRGAFSAPAGVVSTTTYSGSCPASGTYSSIMMYSPNTCFAVGSGVYAQITCNSTGAIMKQYASSTCSGASAASSFSPNGCSSIGNGQVAVNNCPVQGSANGSAGVTLSLFVALVLLAAHIRLYASL